MKKTMKKIITFLLLLSLSLSSIEMLGVKASDTTDVSPAFQVSGASIRFVNNDTEVDGIRFKVAIKTSVYKKLTNAQKDKYRLLIMPKALVSGKLEVGETYTYTVNGQTKSTKAMDLPIWWTDAKQQGDYMETYVYLNGINKSYYATDLVARMYYQENGGVPEYSDECKRSYAAVADAALSDLKSSNTGEYKNAVGSQYSPYNATKRNALLGVKYEKRTGTWDLVDGMLVTDGAAGANTFILERENQLDLSQRYFVLETSIYVPKASDAIKDKLNGMVFGYGTDSYWVLDVNYRNHGGADKWLTNIRGFDSKGANVANAGVAGVAYEEGWYDYRVCVDRSDSTQTLFTVEYKKQNETKYTTLLEKVSIKTSELSITGTRIGYLSTIAKNSENPTTIQYGPNVKKTDGAVQLRGENQTLKLEKELHADGTGVIQGSMICDYRTTGDQNECREGIKFSGTDGNGYLFYIGAQPTYVNPDGQKQPRLYVGMWKWNGTDWVNPDMSAGADVPSYNGMGLNQLKENDE